MTPHNVTGTIHGTAGGSAFEIMLSGLCEVSGGK